MGKTYDETREDNKTIRTAIRAVLFALCTFILSIVGCNMGWPERFPGDKEPTLHPSLLLLDRAANEARVAIGDYQYGLRTMNSDDRQKFMGNEAALIQCFKEVQEARREVARILAQKEVPPKQNPDPILEAVLKQRDGESSIVPLRKVMDEGKIMTYTWEHDDGKRWRITIEPLAR